MIPPDHCARLALRFGGEQAGELYHKLRRHELRTGRAAEEALAVSAAKRLRIDAHRSRDHVRWRLPHPVVMVTLSHRLGQMLADPQAPDGHDAETLPPRFLATLLRQLSPRQRVVIERHVLHDEPPGVLAARLGLSVSRVYSAKCDGLSRLRVLVARCFPELVRH